MRCRPSRFSSPAASTAAHTFEKHGARSIGSSDGNIARHSNRSSSTNDPAASLTSRNFSVSSGRPLARAPSIFSVRRRLPLPSPDTTTCVHLLSKQLPREIWPPRRMMMLSSFASRAGCVPKPLSEISFSPWPGVVARRRASSNTPTAPEAGAATRSGGPAVVCLRTFFRVGCPAGDSGLGRTQSLGFGALTAAAASASRAEPASSSPPSLRERFSGAPRCRATFSAKSAQG